MTNVTSTDAADSTEKAWKFTVIMNLKWCVDGMYMLLSCPTVPQNWDTAVKSLCWSGLTLILIYLGDFITLRDWDDTNSSLSCGDKQKQGHNPV